MVEEAALFQQVSTCTVVWSIDNTNCSDKHKMELTMWYVCSRTQLRSIRQIQARSPRFASESVQRTRAFHIKLLASGKSILSDKILQSPFSLVSLASNPTLKRDKRFNLSAYWNAPCVACANSPRKSQCVTQPEKGLHLSHSLMFWCRSRQILLSEKQYQLSRWCTLNFSKPACVFLATDCAEGIAMDCNEGT